MPLPQMVEGIPNCSGLVRVMIDTIESHPNDNLPTLAC